jgi:hypothetical protein
MPAVLVTDADLARARHDLAFRQQLMAANLDMLISELSKLRDGTTGSKELRQLREGGMLAVKLAELLQKLQGAEATGPAA